MTVTIPEVNTLKALASKDVIVASAGVGSGFLVGDYLAEMAKTTAAQTGWKGVLVKSLVKVGLGLGTGVIAFKAKGSATKIFAALASVGSMGSILVDVFKQVYPGGAEAGGQISGLMLRELALGAESLSTEAPSTQTSITSAAETTQDFAGDHGGTAVAVKSVAKGVRDFAGN